MNTAKRTWNALMTAACLLAAAGCNRTVENTLIKEELVGKDDYKIVRVITTDGREISFRESGGRYMERRLDDSTYRAIAGLTTEGTMVVLDSDRVLEAFVAQSEIDLGWTIALTLTVTLSILLGIIAHGLSQM